MMQITVIDEIADMPSDFFADKPRLLRPDDYAITLRGRLKVPHRHRHTRAERRAAMNGVAVGCVNSFTRSKVRERSMARLIFPVRHGTPQPIHRSTAGPNGSLHVLRFVDLQRPTRAPFGDWRSDLYEDVKLLAKTGSVREAGDDLIYETYDAHWLARVIEFLKTRGYVEA